MEENNLKVSYENILKAIEGLSAEQQESLVKALLIRVREDHYRKIALKAKEANQLWEDGRLMHGSVNDLLADFVVEDIR
jgi:hypothetical protein